MHGAAMAYMRYKLGKNGYDVVVFSYNSVKNTMADNAKQLADFVEKHTEPGAINHFVGHSLGGLLIRLCYEINPAAFTGKIVTLGTPHNGSLVAKRVAEDLHRAILGGAYKKALDGELPDWRGDIPLGSIAGTKCIGVGMAMDDLPKPNDGTVSVAETQLPKQSDHCQISVSHTALIYSAQAVSQVVQFLQSGHFLKKPIS